MSANIIPRHLPGRRAECISVSCDTEARKVLEAEARELGITFTALCRSILWAYALELESALPVEERTMPDLFATEE